MERVAIVKADSYNVQTLYKSLKKAISLVGDLEIETGMKIVIKPNLSDLCSPELGVTTSVRLIEALILLLKECTNVELFIVESDHWAATANEEFKYLGFKDLEKKYDVKLVNLSKDKKIKIKTSCNHLKTLEVPKVLFNCDKIVSVAKLKTHSNEKITCIIKNQFGLLPQRYKSKYHPYLNEILTYLSKLYAPHLCVIDGIIAMEGNGPTDGKPRYCGIVIVGKDPVAIDAAAAQVMGFRPSSVPHLNYASKEGVGSFNFEQVGDNIHLKKFKFIPKLAYLSNRLGLFFVRCKLEYLRGVCDNLAIFWTFMGREEISITDKITRLMRYVRYGA